MSCVEFTFALACDSRGSFSARLHSPSKGTTCTAELACSYSQSSFTVSLVCTDEYHRRGPPTCNRLRSSHCSRLCSFALGEPCARTEALPRCHCTERLRVASASRWTDRNRMGSSR